MKSNNYYLCIFESKNHAVYIYTLLEAQMYNVFQLVSTPCGIKAGCTYSIKMPSKNYYYMVKKEALESNIKAPRVYQVEKLDGKTKYMEIDIN